MNLKACLFIYSILFIPVFNINGAAQITEKKEENIGLNYALLKAIQDQDEKEVKKFIKYGANVNARLGIKSAMDTNRDYITFPIHEASKRVNLNIVKLLLESNANINQKDENGNSALFKAVNLNKKDVVKLLLSLGADINIENSMGYTPLKVARALSEGNLRGNKEFEEIVKLLEEAKLKQDLEEKRKKTTQILIESGHLIEPLAKLTAEYAVAQEDIK